MEERTRAVLYTDGGCKPSRGIGGWGYTATCLTGSSQRQARVRKIGSLPHRVRGCSKQTRH